MTRLVSAPRGLIAPRDPDAIEVPMRRHDLDEEVDAVIVGTGAGGAPIMARLAAAGLRVVALEAGPLWRAREEFATDEREQAKLFWSDERLSAGETPLPFGRNNSGMAVGGSTVHFTAFTPRAQPDDLRLYSEFGVGANWPLSYAELEPYYDEVEEFIGVCGPTPYPWGPPRARGYREPPLPLNAAAQLMRRGCDRLGIRTSSAPSAALRQARWQPGFGWRNPCVNRGFCQAGCSVGAKGSTDVTYIPYAIANGAELRPRSFVTTIELDPRGMVSAVIYHDGEHEQRQRCRSLFLCAGAIETPRLLLLNGLANGSGQVGRNFMAHPGTQVWGEFEEETRPFKGIPAGLISEETHRPLMADFAGGYLMQSLGVMPVTYASQLARGVGLWGSSLRDHMSRYNHIAGINILGECLPSSSNFVELSDELDSRGLPMPRVHFSAGPNEKRLVEHGERLMLDIWKSAGAATTWVYHRHAHTIGTCRMGTNAESAVVDPFGRSFEIPNLFISDNSTFPSALAVNPALTIMALALRTADGFLRHAGA